MKKRTVKYIVTQLIARLGGGKTCHNNNKGREEIAKRLDIHPTYVWKIANGKLKPGKRLYADIIQLCAEMEAKER